MLIVGRLAAGWSVATVAAAAGVTAKTVRKWRDRHAAEGALGLLDRSSCPHRSPARLDAADEDAIETLRRQRLSGPAIARRLGRPVSTIGQVLRRRRLGRLSALDPRPPIVRYEREQPGELIHIDIKKLGRINGIGHRITGDRTAQSNRRAVGKGSGWEYLHVAIDDRSRLAYTQLLPSERQEDATAFLQSSLAWFKQHGVTVERVMTDNGSAYKSKLFAKALNDHGIAHKRTRPYTPKTNGKAERFIQSQAPARQIATQAQRTVITFNTAVRECPDATQVANITRAFGLIEVDYNAIREATEEHIARSAKTLTDNLSEKAIEMHLQRIVDAFVRSAHGAGTFYQAKAQIARDLNSELSNEDRDEDRMGVDGTANRAERAREFAGQMALQAFAVLAAAEGAVDAFTQVTGSEWKPYQGSARPGMAVDQQAAAAQMAALGM